MPAVNLLQYSDSQQRSAQRALDTLDRLEARLDAHFSVKRRHARKTFRGTAIIKIPSVDSEFTVWTRSISASGLSFICPEAIGEDWVLVGLSPSPDKIVWFSGDVVRRKNVPGEGFWEHGVAFRGRVKD